MVENMEVPEGKLDVIFSVRAVKVVYDHDKYHKLYVTIKDARNEREVQFQHVSPETLSLPATLRKIEKLHSMALTIDNQKLREGAREELLKLIALLLWVVSQ